MKIALITEKSQAVKKEMNYNDLNKEVVLLGHVV